jgi:hypothetical protein
MYVHAHGAGPLWSSVSAILDGQQNFGSSLGRTKEKTGFCFLDSGRAFLEEWMNGTEGLESWQAARDSG